MTVVALRRCVLVLGLVTMAACGGPVAEEMDPATVPVDEAAQVEGSSEAALECTPTVIEKCSPDKRTCSVRCCNNSLHEMKMECGGCRAFADYNCIGNGGPLHIRWKP